MRNSSVRIFDYIQLTPHHSIYEVAVPESWEGKTIVQLGVRQKYHISILAIKQEGQLEPLPKPDRCFQSGETMLILGADRDVQKFLRG